MSQHPPTCFNCISFKLRGFTLDKLAYGACWHADHHQTVVTQDHRCDDHQNKVVYVSRDQAKAGA